jgi:rod shape-determining protein MreD
MTHSLPALSVLVAVVATAVPWGLPADATFILPLIVVMMVFCWRTIPGAALHPAGAVGLGLLADIMSGGPLGYWALMCLVAATVGRRPGSLRESRDVWINWLIWAPLVILLAGFGWLLASLYYLRWVDWWPIAFGAVTSIAMFPVILYGVLWIRYGRIFGYGRATIFRGAS